MPELYYRLSEIPDGLELVDELDLTVKWETALEPDELSGRRFTGIEELNDLFRRKAVRVLKEKNASCAHVKHETVSHALNYAHMTSVMTGEYHLTLYAPAQRDG